MLYKFFSAIKTQLVAEVATLKGVEWFNDQYNGTILKDPVCFVEFPEPIVPETISKDINRSPITVRLHVLSKVITKIDNTVPDQSVIDHEAIAVAARDAIRNQRLSKTVVVTPATEELPEVTASVDISTHLLWVRWQHFHKFQGWMVTTIDFSFRTTEV